MNTPPAGRVPAVLLVEDNPDDRELTLAALAGLADEVALARDGVEALDYLFATGPHAARDAGDLPQVMLLDLKLPRLDGLEVLRRVRDDDRTRRLPVVILTSSNEESDLVRGYDLGANSYVRKPVDFDRFNELLQHLGRYWLDFNEAPLRRRGAGAN